MNPDINILAYAAALLGISSTLLLAEKRKTGWALNIISNLIFIYYGLEEGIGSFIVVQIAGIVVSGFALDQWIQKKKRRRSSRKKSASKKAQKRAHKT